MLFGAVGMSTSMVILAITDSIGTSKSGIGTTVFLFVFNTFFASKSLSKSLEFHSQLYSWMARHDLALPCRDRPIEDPSSSERCLNNGQLVMEFRDCDDHTCCISNYWL